MSEFLVDDIILGNDSDMIPLAIIVDKMSSQNRIRPKTRSRPEDWYPCNKIYA